MTTGFVRYAHWKFGLIVTGPLPIEKLIVFVDEAEATTSLMAWYSEPGPFWFVFVTVNVPAFAAAAAAKRRERPRLRDRIDRLSSVDVMKTVLIGTALLVAACATRNSLDLSHSEVVDLTYSFDEHTLYWPNSPSGFELKRLAFGPAPGGYFYASNSFCAPEHGGTHLDAPIHFAEKGLTIDKLPLSQLVAPAILIDVTDKTSSNPDYRLTTDDVRSWEGRNGEIPAGTIVLLRTGWGKRYPDRKTYFG